ncbi:FAD-binding domain-containing protein [Rhypophila decipiens]|uniref:Delta(24)-sterol reductase n=1 Tax=Rhypophila decipiens TaxID=261697 RepID=A0AAN6XZL4_9PEZI|nr:FAD-binding domain-containing protein [Rhypophila decipiens]
MDHHNEAVTKIAKRVKEFHAQGKPFRIYHGSTNTTRRATRSPDLAIDISGLKSVLSVRKETKTALVEPNVPMDALVKETLKHGLVPPVVMEFPGITCGGAFAGTGGESSSFRWGTFDRIVNGVEIVLADGEVVWASEAENSDLFDASAGAFGTFGVVTLLEVQLVPAKSKLVRLSYHSVQSAAEATVTFRQLCEVDAVTGKYAWDYIDGIMFSPRSGVIITGKILDEPEKVTATYSRAIDNWYYSDVQDKLKAHLDECWVDVVPIQDYLFRYDRGAFWCARHSFDYLGLPFNTFTRWLLDGFMHTRDLFNMLHATGTMINSIIQDLCIPAKNVEMFISYATVEFGLWPLWLCPIKPNAGRGIFQLSPGRGDGRDDLSDDLWINVGLWGRAPPNVEEAVAANMRLEEVVQELGGYKWLYGQTFYTEEQFWDIYPKKQYDELRIKYRATSLPSAYDKVKTEVRTEREKAAGGWKEIWPFEAIIAFFGAITGFGKK